MTSLENSDDWISRAQLDETSRVIGLFIAHRSSIELLEAAPELLLLDSTYKTNRYRMPLFSIAGVTALGTTFHVAIAFLLRERQDEFEWALRQLGALYDSAPIGAPETLVSDRDLGLMAAIREVFPAARQRLCLWHVEKNVLARCKRLFRTGDAWIEFFRAWGGLLRSATPEAYFEALGAFRARYDGSDAMRYLERTWLPHREALVQAWTDRSLNLLGLLPTDR
jgi:hypothetical protein